MKKLKSVFDLGHAVAILTRREIYDGDKFQMTLVEPEVEAEGFLFPAKSFDIDGVENLIKLKNKIGEFISMCDNQEANDETPKL